MKTRGKPVDISAINADELKQWIQDDANRQNAIKCQALIALTKNISVTAVCTVLGVTRETLSQWRKRIAKEGIAGLTAKTGKGRKAGLTKQIEEDLKVQLLKAPSELGYTQAIWDGKLVCKYIKEKYSLTIAVRTSQDWLRKIGFTRQRPRYSFNKADQELNEQFKADVKKNSRNKKAMK
jgi:transposase